MTIRHLVCSVFLCVAGPMLSGIQAQVQGQPPNTKSVPLWKKGIYHKSVPQPTRKNIPYGQHKRNVLDFWKAESNAPTPVVVSIHGGGWNGGDKSQLHSFVDTQRLLDAGISVAAINYRLIKHSQELNPPVKGPLFDAARAVQFIRSMSDQWNIDRDLIAATGGSAGACTSLWLAYRDDLADPASEDPLARESSRLFCVAAIRGQTTLDPKQMKQWMPKSKYGGHAFGRSSFSDFLADRDVLLPTINQYSPFALLDAEDPDTYLFYPITPEDRNARNNPTHSAIFGVELQKRCRELGVQCELAYPGAVGVNSLSPTDYLLTTLTTGEVGRQ